MIILNENTILKVNRLVEEVNSAVQNSVSKVRGGDIVTTIPGISPFGQMHQGYKVGNELGHPVVGTLLGAEAAAGARSKNDNTVSIGDVYTKKNMTKRAIQGGVLGAGISTMSSIQTQKAMENPNIRHTIEHIAQNENGIQGIMAQNVVNHADHPLLAAGEEALAAGAGAALLAPAIKYGLGKVFGKKQQEVPVKN